MPQEDPGWPTLDNEIAERKKKKDESAQKGSKGKRRNVFQMLQAGLIKILT